MMGNVMLLITTAICAIGWLTRYVSTASLVYYLERKGYPQPSAQEIHECTLWVVKNMFKR